jgi:hypothetical protein
MYFSTVPSFDSSAGFPFLGDQSLPYFLGQAGVYLDLRGGIPSSKHQLGKCIMVDKCVDLFLAEIIGNLLEVQKLFLFTHNSCVYLQCNLKLCYICTW